jgi:hypothetical protein
VGRKGVQSMTWVVKKMRYWVFKRLGIILGRASRNYVDFCSVTVSRCCLQRPPASWQGYGRFSRNIILSVTRASANLTPRDSDS